MRGNHSQEMVSKSKKHTGIQSSSQNRNHKLSAYSFVNKKLARENNINERLFYTPSCTSELFYRYHARPPESHTEDYLILTHYLIVTATDLIPEYIRNRPCGFCYSIYYEQMLPKLLSCSASCNNNSNNFNNPTWEIYFILSCQEKALCPQKLASNFLLNSENQVPDPISLPKHCSSQPGHSEAATMGPVAPQFLPSLTSISISLPFRFFYLIIILLQLCILKTSPNAFHNKKGQT